MCAIAGAFPGLKGGVGTLSAMLDSMRHRGPDGRGLFEDGACLMGHQRLAVIDLSGGIQPFSTPDGRYTIVFNGEIYNYVEIRAELESRGVKFRTNSDTEVLLEAFREWGSASLSRFVGMFAFAIWDRDEKTLFLARDRVGKKPLVYYWDGAQLIFASELKALLSVPGCEPVLDSKGVDLYFALGYIPAPLSIFRKINKLQAGHYLVLKDGCLDVKRYWKPEMVESRPGLTHNERIEEFKSLFENSVRVRLRSDVPIGLFLSGGVDSSAIGAEVVRQGHRLEALTVRFDQADVDLPYSVEVAKALGIRQEIVDISPDLKQDMDRIVWHFDEPFFDTSNIPSYYVAKAASNRFKVVLNGDGGDEAFAGYPHYEWIRWKQAAKTVLAVGGVGDYWGVDPWQIYFKSKSLLTGIERVSLLRSVGPVDVLGSFLSSDPYLQTRGGSSLQRALWADRHVSLPNDLLYKMDIAAGAFGVEGRSPFLDHRLLEWAQELPEADLVRGCEKKMLLRASFSGVLPPRVLNRPKHGFGAPIRQWLQGPLKDLVNDTLPCTLLDSGIQSDILKSFYNGGTAKDGIRLWTVFMFGLWAKRWKARW